MREYEFEGDQFDSLATGGGRPDAIAMLADSQRSRRRLLLVAALRRLTGTPIGATLGSTVALLSRVEERRPDLAAEVFDHPFLDPWFGQLMAGAGDATYLAGLAATAATRAGLAFELPASCPGSDLTVPGSGVAVGVGPGPVCFVGDGRSLAIASRGHLIVVAPMETARWLTVRLIRAEARGLVWTVRVDDLDRWRDRFTARVSPRLPTADFDVLADLVRDAWRLLVAEQPDHAHALRTLVRTIVPVPRVPDDQVSATARDAAGAVALSPPNDTVTLAELLVHELQHAKLNALLDLVELVRPGGPARYHAPWRPDPRPAGALLTGAYAYVAETGFWRAVGDAYRFAYWRAHVAYALRQLAGSGELTPLGERFVAGLRATVDRWAAESVDHGTASRAAITAAAERAAWRAAQG